MFGKKDVMALDMKLKRAMSNEMFLESTMIAASILDENVNNALTAVGDRMVAYPLDGKVRKLNMYYNSKNEYVMQNFDRNTLNQLQLWTEKKERLMQSLPRTEYDSDSFRTIATEGNALVDYFKSKKFN